VTLFVILYHIVLDCVHLNPTVFKGLVAPVLRNVDKLSFAEVEEVRQLLRSVLLLLRCYFVLSVTEPTFKGLVVPMLRSVDKLSFAKVEKVRGLL
jgi:pyruvate/2-oxoglutarate dehydrogenase complex dihydrolipoamide acyltransferase (E2) component